MGTPKQITLLHGRPLLSIAVDNALSVCSRCIVVTGAHREAARSALPVRPDVEEVYNELHMEGMLTSIAVGAERVRTAWFFVAPGDMPRLPPAVFSALMERAVQRDSHEHQAPAALFPVFQGRRGHPVLISRRVVPDLLQHADQYRSMREFLSRYASVEIEVPPAHAGILLDVDTPADLHSLHSRRVEDSVRSTKDAGGERNV